MTEEPWVIRKSGAFYRSNCAGYTSHIEAAGIYTREFAEREAQTEPQSMSAHPLSEFRPELQHNYEIARRQASSLVPDRMIALTLNILTNPDDGSINTTLLSDHYEHEVQEIVDTLRRILGPPESALRTGERKE